MSVYPMSVTPPSVLTTSSRTVPVTLPPAAAARSTTTEPGLSFATMSPSMRLGAFLPGMRAVVMTMSTSSHCFKSILLLAACHSADISLA